MAEGGSRERCHFFNTPGGCWFEDNCRFLHVKDDYKPICHFYRGPGTCRNGDKCYYRHTQDTVVRAQDTAVKAQTAQWPKENIALPSKENVIKDQGDNRYNQNEGPKEVKPLTDISNLVTKPRESFLTTEKSKKPPITKAKVKKSAEKKENDKEDEEVDDLPKEDNSADPRSTNSRSKSVTCGECGEKFEEHPDTDPLLDHYMQMFMKFDNKHLEFTRRYPNLDSPAVCSICKRFFCEVRDYIRHVKDKVKNGKDDAQKHRDVLENVAIDFCSRDIGIMSKQEFRDSLRTSLVSSYEGMDSDDSDSEVGGLAALLSYLMRKKSSSGMLSPYDMFDDDDDDSDDDTNFFGFDEDDMFELACQGIKPWDPEAGAALAVLNGYY